jgi:hypothetical protein
VTSSVSFLHIKAAIIVVMGKCHCTANWLSKMQDNKLLMLHWCSFLGSVCCLPFYLQWQPILLLLMDVTMQPFDCWMGETIYCWCSVDAHLRDRLRDILIVIQYSTILHTTHSVIIDNQHTVSIYSHFHPITSRPLSVWATTIHCIWIGNDKGSSHISAFSLQFMAYTSIP